MEFSSRISAFLCKLVSVLVGIGLNIIYCEPSDGSFGSESQSDPKCMQLLICFCLLTDSPSTEDG